MKNGIFQNLANLYVPNFKMEYSTKFIKKYVPGAREVEIGIIIEVEISHSLEISLRSFTK